MERIGEGAWTETQPLRLMGTDFGTRMTVLRVGEDLLVHSPARIDDALAEELDGLGRVRWLVAPNTYHHLFLRRAKERWPEAEVWIAPGVEKKQKQLQPDGVFPAAPDAWRDDVDVHLVGGMPKVNEIVLLHKPSRTLLLTDLLFNFGEPDGWWSRTFLRLADAYGGPKQSRLLRFVTKDRAALRESRDVILGWDFDRVTVCHGGILEGDAKRTLADAMAWLG